jgi:Cu(I)/Ag(I) efflux system membrane protein CusA/SilA
MGTLPLALIGGIWMLYLNEFNFSVAVGVGFIALAGVSVEIGVIMLVYLNQAYEETLKQARGDLTLGALRTAIVNGAGMRVRPVMMTVAAVVAGLLPIMYGEGAGSEIMQRIAAPMIGGMVSAVILTLVLLPAVYYLWRKRQHKL